MNNAGRCTTNRCFALARPHCTRLACRWMSNARDGIVAHVGEITIESIHILTCRSDVLRRISIRQTQRRNALSHADVMVATRQHLT